MDPENRLGRAPLGPGTRIGIYEVGAFLDEGGMGAVYLARDTQLGRTVALKVLPADFTGDATRVRRFEREARALAALNHPHIAQIYSLAIEPGTPPVHAIAMEFVEGQTLAHIGALSTGEALTLAGQIADAIDAAHAAGIVHRDLKPGNVRVTPDRRVKVLDFGIAKVPEATGADTVTSLTAPFTAFGTPGYMSPEQLRGEAVDARADIWAFGCVLYELLSGRRAFPGATAPEAAAATLEREPDWTRLPAATPATIRALLRHCLQKDHRRRLRDIGDARLVIDDALVGGAETPPQDDVARPRLWQAIALAAIALAVAAMWWSPRNRAPAPAATVTRFDVVTPNDMALNVSTTTPTVAISPDGGALVYIDDTLGTNGGRLVVRHLDDATPRVVTGVAQAREPFVSPDGEWIGFHSAAGLQRVPIGGGDVRLLARFQGTVRGAFWQDDGTIVFATSDRSTGLQQVAESGGTPSTLTTPDAANDESDHLFPAPLPARRGILYTVLAASTGATSVAVLDLVSGARHMVVPAAACARYDPHGYLVYEHGATVFAAPFDLASLRVTGEAFAVVDRVLSGVSGCAYFGVSSTGTLAFVPRDAGDEAPMVLVWVDRQGRETAVDAPPRAYRDIRLSPDQSRAALFIAAEDRDLWAWDFAARRLSRVTSHPAQDRNPVWTRDGRRLIYSSLREGPGNLYVQAADGSGQAERLTFSPQNQVPTALSADGRTLLGNQTLLGPWSLFTLPLGDATIGASAPLFDLQGGAFFADLSPDTAFVTYTSDEAGATQVFVRPFPNANTARWQVSQAGGSLSKWSPDGRELFFVDNDGRLLSVPVSRQRDALQFGTPAVVLSRSYETTSSTSPYEVSADGRRFLRLKRVEGAAPSPRVSVWLNALARRP